MSAKPVGFFKPFRLAFLCLFWILSFQTLFSQNPLKVFIYAGQSNAQGRNAGVNAFLFPPSPYDSQIKYAWNIVSGTVFLETGFDTLQAVQVNSSRVTHAGEISFGRNLFAEGLENILIIKVARSGTTLDVNWNPTYPRTFTETGSGNGGLYWLMINYVESKLAELDSMGIPYEVEAILWHQGEGDTAPNRAPRYEGHFQNFVDSVQVHLDPEIEVYPLSIYNPSRDPADVALVRDGLENVALIRDHVHFVNVDSIYYDENGQINSEYSPDGIHYTTPGYFKVGDAYTAAYLAQNPIIRCDTLVTQDTFANISVVSVPPSDCDTPDGAISLSGNTQGLIFSIDGGMNFIDTLFFPNLMEGSYTLFVQDSAQLGCSVAYPGNPIVLSAPDLPVIQGVQVTDLSDCEVSDGSILVNASGVNLRYQLNGQAPQASNQFTGLAEGSYSLTVYNQNIPGCVEEREVEIRVPSFCGPSACEINTNLALGGTARQSSTYGNGVANFAIDGNTTGNDNWGADADMHHTNSESGAWWEVDLGATYNLDTIVIYNRTTTTGYLLERLRDFYVFMSESEIDGDLTFGELITDPNITHTFFSGAAGQVETLPIENVLSRYVLIKLIGSGPLHMAEVEVYGCDPPPPSPECEISINDINSTDISQCGADDGTITVAASGSYLEYSIDNGQTFQASSTFSGLNEGMYEVVIRKRILTSCNEVYVSNPIYITEPVLPIMVDVTVTGVSTCDGSDGSITINATGTNNEYSIDGGQSWQDSAHFPNLIAGMYDVVVRDVTEPSCDAVYESNPVWLSDPSDAISFLSVTAEPVSDCGLRDGSIAIQVTGDTVEYSIDGGLSFQASPLFTGLDSGFYELAVRRIQDSSCVKAYPENPVRMEYPDVPLIAQVEVGEISDCGLEDASIQVLAVGDSLEYSIDAGLTFQDSSSFRGLSPGNYAIFLREKARPACSTEYLANPVQIVAPVLPEIVSVNANGVSDCNLQDGSIEIIAIGDSLEYSIDGGLSYHASTQFSNLDTGSYVIQVREVERPNCQIAFGNTPLVIMGPSVPAITSVEVQGTSDCGLADGEIRIDALGDSILYSIDGGVSFEETGIFPNLPAGFYEVWVKEAISENCMSRYLENPVEIPNPVDLAIDSVQVQPISDCGLQNGVINIFASGGNLEFSIDGGGSFQDSALFSGLDSGSYQIFIRDSQNQSCTQAYQGNPVRINLPQAPLISQVLTSQITDCGLVNAEISILAEGDSLEYSIDGGTLFQGSNVFSGLGAGNYNVVVREVLQSGCTTSYSPNPLVITTPAFPAIVSVDIESISDCGVSDGQISISATGNTLEYSIDGGNTFQTASVFSELTSGEYDVQVREVSQPGCSVVHGQNPIQMVAPLIPQITQVLKTDQSNCELLDGSISILASGDSLEYSLDNSTYQPGNTFMGLGEGNYKVYVKESGTTTCIDSSSTLLTKPEGCEPCITENLALGGGVAAFQSSTYGNGVASFAIDGNTTGNDNWGADADMHHTNSEPGAWWKVDLGVEATLDSVVIYNRTSTQTYLLGRLREFYLYTSTREIDGNRSIEELNADVDIEGQYFVGSAGPIETFYLNQVQGRYVLVKLTGSGPLHMAEVEVYGCDGPPPVCDIVLSGVNTSNPSECGLADASITIGALGNDIEYSIDGISFQASPTFTGLTAGSYDISIRKSTLSSCVVPYTGNPVVISDPPPPTVSGVNILDQSDCLLADGEITIEASGGNLEYSIDGVNYQVSNTFTDLSAGNYRISVRNIGNCVGTYINNPVVISAPDAPEIADVFVTDLSDCDVSDGSITISAPGNNMTFSLDGVSYQSSPTFTGLAEGVYTVSVRNEVGCEGFYDPNPVSILAPSFPAITSIVATDQSDCEVADGSLTIAAVGNSLEYSLDGANYQPQNQFVGLTEGTYSVFVREVSQPGCVATSVTDISVPSECGIEECTTPTNLALNKPAFQSSTYGNGVASFTNDGNTIGNDNWGADANLSHTNSGAGAWWKVDLEVDAVLDNLVIYNRTTTTAYLLARLSNFYVYVSHQDIDGNRSIESLNGDSNITGFFFSGTASSQEAIALNDIQGRFVLIKLTGNGPLHMAEVEVNGCDGPAPVCDIALLSVNATDATNCENPDGSITVSATGSSLEYSLDGSQFQSSASFSGLNAGSYTVVIRKSTLPGCEESHSNNPVILTSPDGPALTNVEATIPTDCGAADGTITVSAEGSNLSYSLNGGLSYQSANIFTGLGAGEYTIWVKNESGCVRIHGENPVVLVDPSGPTITSVAETDQSDCESSDGSLVITASGSSLEYSLDGSTYQSSNVFTDLAAGSYTAFVRESSSPTCETSTVAEIGKPVDCGPEPCMNPVNLAINQPSTQSSTYGNGVAALANDGNTVGDNPWGSSANLQHTDNVAFSWWQVDLGEEASLDRVEIYNRTTSTTSLLTRLRDFYVYVSDTEMDGNRSISSLNADSDITHSFFAGAASLQETLSFSEVTGRYIMIKLSGNGPLHLAEVEVYGCPRLGSGANSLRRADAPLDETSKAAELDWDISPNPFNKQFILQVYEELEHPGHVYIYNALGQLIEQTPLPSQRRLTLGTGLAPGMYWVKLSSGTRFGQMSIIKTR